MLQKSKISVFLFRLINSKSPQVSRTLLSILVDLNNAVVSIVSTRLLVSKSSSHFINLLGTTKSTNYNLYYCYFHVPQFFQFYSNVEVFSFFSLSCVSFSKTFVWLDFNFLHNSQWITLPTFCLFVMPPWVSPLFTTFSYQPFKKNLGTEHIHY